MAWAFDAEEFEYDDWSPYAVYEGDEVLVIKSEGDYFFALKVDSAGNEWRPLPLQSGSKKDIEQLRLVIARLLDAEPESRPQELHGDEWRTIDDYDSLWGLAQHIGSHL